MCVPTQQQIDLFFRDPSEGPMVPGNNNTLYLLRRDVNDCILEKRYLFLGVMGVLAGVDLLAKFLTGQEGPGVGDRFKQFLREYFSPLDPGDDETLYQFRNSLLHSFGLYSCTRNGREFHFRVSSPPTRLLQDAGQDTFLVGVEPLQERFEKAVARFSKDILTRQTLMDNFVIMFPKYGSIHVS